MIADKKIEELKKEIEKYAEENGFRLNPNKQILIALIKGLLANEKKYGKRYCPCRRITGDQAKNKDKICPCKWHKEEIKNMGHCHCMLFYN